MKKLLFIIALFISVSCYSQVTYVVQEAGKYQAYGLSTDTKPINPPTNCLFTETNTGNMYRATAGSWVLVAAASTATVPTNTNQLTNGAGYITAASLPNMANYLTTSTAASTYATVAQLAAKQNTITVLPFANGGIGGATGLSATTGTITVPMVNRILTCTPTGAMTLNATGGIAGQQVTFIFTTSGTTSRVITFGTNFRKVGTLTTGTVSGRFFTVTFICIDGVIWHEISRTAVQN